MLCAKKEELKLLVRVIISLTLCFALFISGARAYMTSDESTVNQFDVALIRADICENIDNVEYGPDVSAVNELTEISDYSPGDQLTVAPYIENTGAADVYAFMLVGIPKAYIVDTDEYGIPVNNGNPEYGPVFEYSLPQNTRWFLIESEGDSDSDYDYYVYGYKDILVGSAYADQNSITQTDFLFEAVDFKSMYDPEGELSPDTCDIILRAYYINPYAVNQINSQNEEAIVRNAWSVYKTKSSWDFPETASQCITWSFVCGNSVVSTGTSGLSDLDDTITVPAATNVPSGYTFIDWVDEQGNRYDPGDTPIISDLLLFDEVNSTSGNDVIANPNAVITARLSKEFAGDNSTIVCPNPNYDPDDPTSNQSITRSSVVKLMPYEYLSDGETSNPVAIVTDNGDGSGPWFNSYASHLLFWDTPLYPGDYLPDDGTTRDAQDNITDVHEPVLTYETESFVFGIQPGTTIDELFDEYVYVQGKGYAVVESSCGHIAGTGTVIRVYDNKDTPSTADDTLVQQMSVVVFGDFNGDSRLNNRDWTLLSNALDADANFDDPREGYADGDGIIELGDVCQTYFSLNPAAYWAADIYAFDEEFFIMFIHEDSDGIGQEEYDCYFTQGYISGTINAPDYQSGDIYIDQNLGVMSSVYDWIDFQD